MSEGETIQSPRDKLIERVRKLSRMTAERGASESEAMQAAELVRRLCAEHNIGQDELSIRADAKSCVKDAYVSIRSKQPAWTRVCVGIERLYGTICWYETKQEDLLELGFDVETAYVVYYGFPVDVACSIATLAICAQALEGEIASRKFKRGERESFELGMCARMNERIREMRGRGLAEAKGQGALVVLKDQLVREEFGKLGQRLHRTAARATVRDAAAYAAGQRAGDRVALDRAVGQERRRISG